MSATYVIHWRLRQTGASGHGSPIDYRLALAWIEDARRAAPEIDYWLVPVDGREHNGMPHG